MRSSPKAAPTETIFFQERNVGRMAHSHGLGTRGDHSTPGLLSPVNFVTIKKGGCVMESKVPKMLTP